MILQRQSTTEKKTREWWTFSETFFLLAFLFWTAAGLFFTFAHLTPASVGQWPLPADARNFIDLCIYAGDQILIILAFINTHLHASREWSTPLAQRWAFIIIFCSYAVETVGTVTGLPFGDYHYTDKFGFQLWLVPFTIPLAWHVIITNALFLVRAVVPYTYAIVEAAMAGFICMLYDIVLEPFAASVKGYWTWDGGSVPFLNYASWFIISTVLIRIFAPTLSVRSRLDPRPLLIVGGTVAIFLAGEAASWAYRR